jgi:uncharacterized MAPEG superfamily protein
MTRALRLVTLFCSFAAIALLVYIAGTLALSGSPILALLPVALLLLIIILYIRRQES